MTALPPDSLFSGDDGAADPNLVRRLGDYRAGTGDLAAVVGAFETSRVFVAVIDGPAGHKTLPVFSDLAALSRWSEQARPVPVEARRAALSGVDEGCDLIVIDPGGPVRAVLPRPAVWAVAQGRSWQPSWADPAVREAVLNRVRAVAGVSGASCEAGSRAELRVVVQVVAGLDRSGLDTVTGAVSQALAAEELVAERVDSIELTLRAAS
jgi:hypothetical protein